MWLRAPVIALLMAPRTPLVAGGARTGLGGRTSGLGRRYLARHGSDRTRGRRGAPFDGRARQSPAAGSTVWVVEAWLYTLMIIAVPAFVLGVYAALRREGDPGLPGLGAIAALIFWLFHTIHNLGFVTVLQVVATGYTGAGAEGSAADAVARALLGFANAAFGFGTSVGGVFLIGSMACLGVATLQNGGLPRWTGYAALAAAALALIAYLQVIVPALGPIFGIPGWLLHIAWVIGVTVALVRGRTMSTSHRFGYAHAGVTTP